MSKPLQLTCVHLAPEGMCAKCVADMVAIAQEKGRRERECEAVKFYPKNWEIKTHGCIHLTCKSCQTSYCSHWPMCPQCAMVEVMKKRRGTS